MRCPSGEWGRIRPGGVLGCADRFQVGLCLVCAGCRQPQLFFGLVRALFGVIKFLIKGCDFLLEALIPDGQFANLGFQFADSLFALPGHLSIRLQSSDLFVFSRQFGAQLCEGGLILAGGGIEPLVGGYEFLLQAGMSSGEGLPFLLEGIEFSQFGFQAGNAAFEIVDFDRGLGGARAGRLGGRGGSRGSVAGGAAGGGTCGPPWVKRRSTSMIWFSQ